MDQKFTKAISPDSLVISKFGLKNGDLIYLQNSTVEWVSDVPKQSAKTTTEVKENPKAKCNHTATETCINCIEKIRKMKDEKDKNNKVKDSKKDAKVEWEKLVGKKQEKPEEEKKHVPSENEKAGLTNKCNHGIGHKCINCMETPVLGSKWLYNNQIEKLKYNCQHGEGGKCPNCVGSEFIETAKHKSFEQYLKEKAEKCKGIHDTSSKCVNCMPPNEIVYKLKVGCPNHPPYPKGLCNKCVPPNANLNRQIYRYYLYLS